MKNIPIAPLAAGFVFLSSSALANTCTYEVQKDSTQVGWTAYKTSQKVAVQGSFPKAAISGPSSKKELKALLEGAKADISLNEVADIHTENPGRDNTLFSFFFSLFKDKKVKASVEKVKGSDTEGDFELKLSMNGVTKAVSMHYIRDNAGKLEAKGELDILDYKLDKAHESLNKACNVLHKGADGVSKTWTNVGLRLTSIITKNCK